ADVPRRLRYLYMVEREVECFRLSLGEELAVHSPALHRPHRVRLHRMASLYRTLADAWQIDLRDGRARHGESVVSGIFSDRCAGVVVSSRRRHLEFSL